MYKINKSKLDPVTLYPTEKIAVMLQREELAVPDKNDFDDDEQYSEGLIEVCTICTRMRMNVSPLTSMMQIIVKHSCSDYQSLVDILICRR